MAQQKKKQDNKPRQDGKKDDGKKGGGGQPAAAKAQNKGLSQEEIRAKRFAIRNARASFVGVLQGWGIPISPLMDRFIAQSARKRMSGDAFMAAVRKTKAYARAFPGIMQPNGVMRMTEAEYLAGFEDLRDFGASIGHQMTKDEYGMALKNGNSIAEVRQKFEAVDVLNRNRAILDEFGGYITEMGIAKQPPNREDLLKFVAGMGPKEWEMAYDSAVISQRSKQAGLKMTFGEIKHLINQIETSGIGDAQDITPDVFAKVADNLRHVGFMKRYGIDDKDAILASFGLGPRRDLVNDVMKNAEAFAGAIGRVEKDPFEDARADRFTQGETRRSGASY